MLTEAVCVMVATSGGKPNRRTVRLAAEHASPEFERLWEAGRLPALRIDGKGGRLVIEVTDDGPR